MPMRLLPKRLVGQTIRGIRNRLGMSQADFANAVGAASAALVARWEKGQAQPDYGTLAKIATMGVVDVLVFHEEAAGEETPQLRPGEANELRDILLRMEALLDDARRIVDQATNRTALEALEAATARIPASSAGAEALVLDAEVRLETKPRSRTASAGRRSTASRAKPSSTPRKRGSTGGSRSNGDASSSSLRNGTGGGSSRGSSSRGRAGSSRGSSASGTSTSETGGSGGSTSS